MLQKNSLKITGNVFLLSIITLFTNPIFAQYDSEFEKFTIRDGLSNNDIWQVTQDQYGFLWIATQDGLNIYDGYGFSVFKHDAEDSLSLPSNVCNSIFEDSNGDIWVGTKAGLSKYNRITGTFKNFKFSNNSLEFANFVYRIFEDSKLNLWISTSDGIWIFNRADEGFTKYDVMRTDNTIGEFANSAYEIVETQKGELIASTISFGIVKFDYSSKIFIQLKLKDNFIEKLSHVQHIDMAVDNEGNIWTSTWNGLFKVDLANMSGKDMTPFKKINTTQAAFKNAVIGVFNDRNNNIWIGTATHGIYIYNSIEDNFENVYKNNSLNYIGPFYEDKFGVMWITTSQGLWKYDFDKKPFDLVKISNFLEEENNPIVLNFEESKRYKNKIWLGTSSGLYLYDKNRKNLETTSDILTSFNNSNNYIVRPIIEEGVNIWIGTFNSGLFHYNLTTKKIQRFESSFYDNSTINHDNIISLINANDGNLWVGTNFGINIVNIKSKKIKSIPAFMSRQYGTELKELLNELSKNSTPTSSILEVGDYADLTKDFVLTSDENIIISSFGEGLFQWNMVDYGWLESNDGEIIWSSKDLSATYHAGGNGKNRVKIGMLRLKKGRYKLRYISDDSHSTKSYNAPPPQDTTSWGVVMYSLGDESYSKYEKLLTKDNSSTYLDGQRIEKLFLASDNTIWVATNFGISRINKETYEVINYRKSTTQENSISSEDVFDLVEDLNGNIWIATSEGLNMLNPNTNIFSVIKEKDGLPSDQIRSIEIDDIGDIWIGTLSGISKIEISNGYENPVIINYDAKDGLQGYEFIPRSSFKDSNGKLYFAGTEGFNVFQPGKSNNSLPFVALNEILISNKRIATVDAELLENTHINLLSELSLPHDKNDLSFEFASIHFSRPDKNRVQYKMDGVDEDWIISDRRFSTYTNLDPGDYVFNIKGSNGDGIWNEKVRQIRISISPPWYNNWTAYSIYAAFFLGLLFSVRKIEVTRQQKNAQIKESQHQLEAAHLKAEAAEAKALVVQAENDRKTEELEEARSLQLSMLPKKLPELPNLDIAVYMKTATEVGGDYYDFHIGMDGTLTVVLGDATGHGMKAGTMVTTTKSLFNVLAPNPDIVETFHEMTRCLKLMHLEKLSMCMTMIKIVGNKIRMSAAGMPPIYIYKRESQSIEEHLIKGMPLGTFSDFPYSLVESSISSGDTILMMSDGFPELMNSDKEMFSYKKTRNLFEDIAGDSPEDIISKLTSAGSDWVNDADPDDDVTFVVIKVK